MTSEQIQGYGPFEADEVLCRIQVFSPDGKTIAGVVAKFREGEISGPGAMERYWRPIAMQLTQSIQLAKVAE